MSHLEPAAFGGVMGGLDYEAHWSQTTPMCHESYPEPTDEYRKSATDSGKCGQNVGQMERALSVAAGFGLATFGLKRGRLTGLVLTALGGGLVWRGLSGRFFRCADRDRPLAPL